MQCHGRCELVGHRLEGPRMQMPMTKKERKRKAVNKRTGKINKKRGKIIKYLDNLKNK